MTDKDSTPSQAHVNGRSWPRWFTFYACLGGLRGKKYRRRPSIFKHTITNKQMCNSGSILAESVPHCSKFCSNARSFLLATSAIGSSCFGRVHAYAYGDPLQLTWPWWGSKRWNTSDSTHRHLEILAVPRNILASKFTSSSTTLVTESGNKFYTMWTWQPPNR